MSEKSNPIGFKRALTRAVGALFGMGALTALVFNNAILDVINGNFSPSPVKTVRVTAAVQEDIKTLRPSSVSASLSDAPSTPILAEIDVRKAPELALAASSALLDQIREQSLHEGTDWFAWARLDAAPCKVALNRLAQDSGVSVYAVRLPEGASLCIVNRSDYRQKIQARTRLTHGVYSVEKISLAAIPGTNQPAVVPSAPLNDRRESVKDRNVERLPGRNLVSDDYLKLQIQLEPGEISLLRFTDTALKSRQALNDVRDRLNALSQSSPNAAQKLQAILSGFDANRVGVSATGARKSGDRVGGIHHFLLALFQAHTLHKNFLDTKSVPQKQGASLMEAFDRLTNHLADTSINLLGLVPKIEVAADNQAVSTTSALENDDAATPQRPSYLVTISVANQGTRTATLVKLGMNSNTLPKGSSCLPEDPAIFETLTPGQTVKATYRLSWSGEIAPLQSRCVGEISYFTAGAPAHFYLSPL